jgi:hypothetical protein
MFLFSLLVLVGCCLHLGVSARCTVIADVVELSSLGIAGFSCSSPDVICDDFTGPCHIISVTGDMYVSCFFGEVFLFLLFSDLSGPFLSNISFPLMATVVGKM